MDENKLNDKDIDTDIQGRKDRVIPVEISAEMKKSYLEYSMSVIVSRALPDVRDGLKPVHRRILYTMYENNLHHDRPYRKSVDTVGRCLASYHPHGDASVYDALVRMAQDFSMRYTLIDGHGNFGSIDGDPAAAYRYTEARLAKLSSHMLTDIDKDTVDFKPNFDDKNQEPVVLPARYPNMLVNGASGIAVGMATNIPPHNLCEVIDGMCELIDNPEATFEEVIKHIKGPDFPTGGTIMGLAGIRAAYLTGRGKLTVRAKSEIEEMKNGRHRIVINEIPYQVNKARLIEHIAELVKDKRIEHISDLRDESDRDGMRIVVELKKDANPQIVLNQLYSYSQLQDTFGVIMLALVDGEPKTLGLIDILKEYIKYQYSVVTRSINFDLKKAREREHILEALKVAIDFIDEVISIIRKAKSIPEAKNALIERFNFDDVQASSITSMQLGRLTGLERQKLEDELNQLIQKIAELEDILADDLKIYAIIKEDARKIKEKFGDERRTAIEMVSGEVDIEELIPVEDCVITLTHCGYIKRQLVDTYKSQKRGGRGVTGLKQKEEDFVEELFICSTHDYILFFTNKGRVYRLKAYEIAESSRIAKGTNIVNLLQISGEEKVTSMIKVSSFEDNSYFVLVTKNGLIKRIKQSEYDTARKAGVIAITLSEDDELAWVNSTTGDDHLIIATKNGMALRFNENDVRPSGRSSMGVRSIRLSQDDEVVGISRIRDGASLFLTVTENGRGRITNVDNYRLQKRGGKGSTNYKVDDIKGKVAGIKIVDKDDDIIMITSEGVIIRISLSDINPQSRYGSGVRVMKVSENERIVTLARATKEVENDEDEALDSGEQETATQEIAADEKV